MMHYYTVPSKASNSGKFMVSVGCDTQDCTCSETLTGPGVSDVTTAIRKAAERGWRTYLNPDNTRYLWSCPGCLEVGIMRQTPDDKDKRIAELELEILRLRKQIKGFHREEVMLCDTDDAE